MSSRRTGKHRIYMNVGYDLTEEQLRQFFSQYGHVTDVYLPKHKSGRNKGFGFTTFDSEDSLQAALQAEEYVIGGEVVRINRAGPRPESELQRDNGDQEAAVTSSSHSRPYDSHGRQPQLFGKGPRLYVGGVPEELTDERLKAHFSRWGNVVDIYFPGKKGQSRVNYCFVTFDNWRAAQRACNQSERNIDGILLQSINLAQERTAEQETAQRASSMPSVPASDAQPNLQPNAATLPFGSTPFGVNPLAASQSLPAYNMMQQLHLQIMQAQALQAQQLGVGISAQQQQPLPGVMPPADPAQMSAFLASYPAAYQQLLANMAAYQGHRVSPSPVVNAASPALPLNPMAAAAGYNLASIAPFQFPQAMPGLPSDLSHLLATGPKLDLAPPTAEQQAGVQQAVHSGATSLRPEVPIDASRVPSMMTASQDAMAGFTQASAGPYPNAVPTTSNPSMWGWGSALTADSLPGATAMDFSAMAQNVSGNPQTQSRPGSAAGPSIPMTGSQFGGFY